MNRVTDTCIPEVEAMRRIEAAVLRHWVEKDRAGERFFPHEFMYEILRDGSIKESYQIDPKHSWMLAAAEKNLPMFVPGWEDSTLGNMYSGHCISRRREERAHRAHRHRVHDRAGRLVHRRRSAKNSIGFFQIGGGIAGDFPICVVPMLHQDLQRTNVPLWGYFCQISDSTTSYGSYSGAVPNEKITWGKLGDRHAQVHHRIGCHDRGAAGVRVRAGLVDPSRGCDVVSVLSVFSVVKRPFQPQRTQRARADSLRSPATEERPWVPSPRRRDATTTQNRSPRGEGMQGEWGTADAHEFLGNCRRFRGAIAYPTPLHPLAPCGLQIRKVDGQGARGEGTMSRPCRLWASEANLRCVL